MEDFDSFENHGHFHLAFSTKLTYKAQYGTPTTSLPNGPMPCKIHWRWVKVAKHTTLAKLVVYFPFHFLCFLFLLHLLFFSFISPFLSQETYHARNRKKPRLQGSQQAYDRLLLLHLLGAATCWSLQFHRKMLVISSTAPTNMQHATTTTTTTENT